MSGTLDPKTAEALAAFLEKERTANGWRERIEGLVQKSLHASRSAEQAATRGCDEVLSVREQLREHIATDRVRHTEVTAKLDSLNEWKKLTSSRMDRIEGTVDDVEEVTGQHYREKLESERAKVKEGNRLKWWVLGIVGGVTIAALSGLVTLAVQGLSRPTGPNVIVPAR